MNQLTLELFLHIIGIGAASGLIHKDNQLQIIADNANVLYTYEIDSGKLSKNSLNENGNIEEGISKKYKNDFEAIVTDGKNYYIFGSGSKKGRNKLVEVNVDNKEIIREISLKHLYFLMKLTADIDDKDFNIEGFVMDAETWYLFNRGNGPIEKNGVFTITTDKTTNKLNIVFNSIELPKIDGVSTGFTDATLVDGKIYFLAAAEDSKSTYDDGKVLGSLIGRLNIQNMEVEETKLISNTHKFEGISLYQKDGKNLSFLLCEDADNPNDVSTKIYKLNFVE